MPRITNWRRESRSPTLAYRNTETGVQAVLHRAPDSYRYKWRGAILVDGYPVWSRGYETKDATAFRDELRERPARTSAVRSVRTRTFVSARKRQTGRMSSGGTTAPTVGTKPPHASSTAPNGE